MSSARVTALIGGAVAAGSLAVIASRRRPAKRNPSGLTEANLSAEERREAAEELGKSWCGASEPVARS